MLIDPAWLLHRYQLSDDGETEIGGRPALRLNAAPEGDTHAMGWGAFSSQAFLATRAQIVIDCQLGVTLRQTWYHDDQPLLITELTAVTVGVSKDAFNLDIAPGTRLLTNPTC